MASKIQKLACAFALLPLSCYATGHYHHNAPTAYDGFLFPKRWDQIWNKYVADTTSYSQANYYNCGLYVNGNQYCNHEDSVPVDDGTTDSITIPDFHSGDDAQHLNDIAMRYAGAANYFTLGAVNGALLGATPRGGTFLTVFSSSGRLLGGSEDSESGAGQQAHSETYIAHATSGASLGWSWSAPLDGRLSMGVAFGAVQHDWSYRATREYDGSGEKFNTIFFPDFEISSLQGSVFCQLDLSPGVKVSAAFSAGSGKASVFHPQLVGLYYGIVGTPPRRKEHRAERCDVDVSIQPCRMGNATFGPWFATSLGWEKGAIVDAAQLLGLLGADGNNAPSLDYNEHHSSGTLGVACKIEPSPGIFCEGRFGVRSGLNGEKTVACRGSGESSSTTALYERLPLEAVGTLSVRGKITDHWSVAASCEGSRGSQKAHSIASNVTFSHEF